MEQGCCAGGAPPPCQGLSVGFQTELVNSKEEEELAILAAPLDDEPEMEDERASVASSLADASPDIPFEQLRRKRT
jgi:hypothetical protein